MTLKTKLIAITLSVLIATLLAISLPVSLSVSEQKSQPIKFDELPKDYQFNRFTLEDDNDSIKLDNIPKLYKYLPNSQVKTAVLLEEDKHGSISEETVVNESIKEVTNDKLEEKEVIDDIQEIKDEGSEDWMTFEATAYTAFCSTGCIGITRTGYDVSETIYYEGMRVIAVDPNVIPLHSIVEVDTGEKVFTAIALDTGGNIKSYRIDILKETKEGALRFGRRDVEIKIKKIGGTK